MLRSIYFARGGSLSEADSADNSVHGWGCFSRPIYLPRSHIRQIGRADCYEGCIFPFIHRVTNTHVFRLLFGK